MSEFLDLLKQSQLSDNANSLYLSCLGRPELTKGELSVLIPDLSPENFTSVINELMSSNLLIQITSAKPEIPEYYLAILPFTVFLKYFSTISDMISSNQELINNSINQVFKGEHKIELNSAFNQFQMLVKEHTEAITSQKKDFEINLGELEKINELNKTLDNLNEILTRINDATTSLHQNIRGITQSQFGNLIQILKTIKTQLGIELNKIDNRKYAYESIKLMEEVFSAEFQEMVDRFTDTIFSLVDMEFQNYNNQVNQLIDDSITKKVDEPIRSITNNLGEIKNESKSIVSNMVNRFDSKLEEIKRIILTNKDSLPNNLQNLGNIIKDNVNNLFQDSINKISDLKEPIENLLRQFHVDNPYSKKLSIDNIWLIRSTSKVNEEIQSLIKNSKGEVSVIIPRIEDYLSEKIIKEIPNHLLVKIASSNQPTDSVLTDIINKSNIEFRILANENIVALMGDHNHVIIGVVNKDSDDSLNNLVGIGSNFKPLVDMLTPIIETSWSAAKPPKLMPATAPQPIAQIGERLESRVEPKLGDKIGMEINAAFDNLIEKLNKLQGWEFSNELQKVSDLIFEKAGFSVSTTLHKISTMVGIFKPKYVDLENSDKTQIFTSIESWKQEIFSKTGMHL